MPMPVLLAAHRGEFVRLLRIIHLQAVGKIVVDACVLFFERDGEREDVALGQTLKCAHGKMRFRFFASGL